MSINFLKLNSEKTELLLIGNPTRLAKITSFELILDDFSLSLQLLLETLEKPFRRFLIITLYGFILVALCVF